jgi:anti-sigma-K factor RskA
MSTHEHDNGCLHHMDAAPYVLGALEENELRAYRTHLEDCAECRQEVAELQIVVNELPASALPIHAPAPMRERIMATVRSEAELLSAAGADADRPAPAAGRWRSRRFSLAGAGAALATGTAVVVAIVLATGSSSKERVTPGVGLGPAQTAQVSLHQRDSRSELVVSQMPQPALGKVYEVWLSRGKDSSPQPTNALFSPTGSGNGQVDVPSSLHGVKEVMVTAEPLGGSSHPTSPPILKVVLSA